MPLRSKDQLNRVCSQGVCPLVEGYLSHTHTQTTTRPQGCQNEIGPGDDGAWTELKDNRISAEAVLGEQYEHRGG